MTFKDECILKMTEEQTVSCRCRLTSFNVLHHGLSCAFCERKKRNERTALRLLPPESKTIRICVLFSDVLYNSGMKKMCY